MSLVKELEQQQSKPWSKKTRGLLLLGVAILSGAGYRWYQTNSAETMPTVVYEDYTVKQGDIRISLESEGKILGDEVLELTSPNASFLREIRKQPGDQVALGEVIAQLDASDAQLAIQQANLAIQQAQANLAWKQSDSSLEEVALSQEQVSASQLALAQTQTQNQLDIQNAKTALEQAELELALIQQDTDTEATGSNVSLLAQQEQQAVITQQQQALTQIGESLSEISRVMYETDVLFGISSSNQGQNDSYEIYLGAKNTASVQTVEQSWQVIQRDLLAFLLMRKNADKTPNGEQVLGFLNDLLTINRQSNELTQSVLVALKASVSSSSFSQTTIDTHIKSFETNLTLLKKSTHDLLQAQQDVVVAQQSLTTKIGTTTNDLQDKLQLAQQSLKKAQLAYDNAVKSAELRIQSAQQQVKIAEATVETKQGGITDAEQRVYQLQVQQAQLQLQQAQQALADTMIVAPRSGTVIAVNASVGEMVGVDKSLPLVELAIDADTYIESRVEEADVIKITNGQAVALSVDAVEGLLFTGQVFFVSRVGQEDANSIVSYKVLIGYDTDNEKIRNGMRVTVDYITKEVNNVLIVPVKAVFPYNGKPSVIKENGDIVSVTPGFTDGKMVEIISGLTKGETILIKQ